MSERNPYRGYSLQDVKKSEATMWYIQIGKQFFEYDGECLWEKDEAEHFYFTLRDGLEHMLRSGDIEEREDAREILINFRLLPLRFV